MKFLHLRIVPLSFLIFLIGNHAFASHGVGSGGGGDIACERLIQDLTYQDPSGNLISWITNGGPEAGQLNLSSSRNPVTGRPYTVSEYSVAMLNVLRSFQQKPDISCVKPGDSGYPVDINNRAKICKTFRDQFGIHMICDRALFMGLNPDEVIEQNHHEFAINVPGLEPDDGFVSTYQISSQLAQSIGTVSERRLVIRKPNSSIPDNVSYLQSCVVIDSRGNGATAHDMPIYEECLSGKSYAAQSAATCAKQKIQAICAQFAIPNCAIDRISVSYSDGFSGELMCRATAVVPVQ